MFSPPRRQPYPLGGREHRCCPRPLEFVYTFPSVVGFIDEQGSSSVGPAPAVTDSGAADREPILNSGDSQASQDSQRTLQRTPSCPAEVKENRRGEKIVRATENALDKTRLITFDPDDSETVEFGVNIARNTSWM